MKTHKFMVLRWINGGLEVISYVGRLEMYGAAEFNLVLHCLQFYRYERDQRTNNVCLISKAVTPLNYTQSNISTLLNTVE